MAGILAEAGMADKKSGGARGRGEQSVFEI